MGTIKKFEELEVWKKSMTLTNIVYSLTKQSEFCKDYYLANQLRKTSISIASNIAEGFERDGNRELINFLYIAKGSCGELRCQLNIAYNQNYLNQEQFQESHNMAMQISISLNKFIIYLKESDIKGIKYK
jgi:four helix bundle protein